jgi:hypothetical protein
MSRCTGDTITINPGAYLYLLNPDIVVITAVVLAYKDTSIHGEGGSYNRSNNLITSRNNPPVLPIKVFITDVLADNWSSAGTGLNTLRLCLQVELT